MTLRSVNRLFTNPDAFNRVSPSSNSFDAIVSALRLSPQQYQDSPELKEWVRRNKDQRYVPTELLNAFGFDVD
jgi:hypothetical protein